MRWENADHGVTIAKPRQLCAATGRSSGEYSNLPAGLIQTTREAFFNNRLAHLAARRLEALGAQTTFIDLRDYTMPLYEGDLEAEQGLPENENIRPLKPCELPPTILALTIGRVRT